MYDGNEQIVVDFANSTVTSIDAGAASGSLSSMDPEQLRALQEIGTDSVMKIKEHDVVPGNAIEMEHDDFIDSILNHREPRVSGQRGHDALELAETIVAEMRRDRSRISLRPAA